MHLPHYLSILLSQIGIIVMSLSFFTFTLSSFVSGYNILRVSFILGLYGFLFYFRLAESLLYHIHPQSAQIKKGWHIKFRIIMPD